MKATRDIFIHNQGVANQIYLTKADTLARVKLGHFLPVDNQYFLQSYECCLQITEILEEALNRIWPSLEYSKNANQNLQTQKDEAITNAIEQAEQHQFPKDGTIKNTVKKSNKFQKTPKRS